MTAAKDPLSGFRFDPNTKFTTKSGTASSFSLPREVQEEEPTKDTSSQLPQRLKLNIGSNPSAKSRLQQMVEADLFQDLGIFQKSAGPKNT
jgi:hypothetical protein